jgi:hypothetical protein
LKPRNSNNATLVIVAHYSRNLTAEQRRAVTWFPLTLHFESKNIMQAIIKNTRYTEAQTPWPN